MTQKSELILHKREAIIKKESRKTKLEIFRSPNSSPTRPIVVVPPIKRIKNYEVCEKHISATPITKSLNKETKKIDKIARPFAIKSSTSNYSESSIFPEPLSETFAHKRKIAQVEPFKVFDEDQPLDLRVKKKKIVPENTKISETTPCSKNKNDLLKCKCFVYFSRYLTK